MLDRGKIATGKYKSFWLRVANNRRQDRKPRKPREAISVHYVNVTSIPTRVMFILDPIFIYLLELGPELNDFQIEKIAGFFNLAGCYFKDLQ